MIVTLLPLLLAANITTNGSDWKYGPEVIYDARIDSLTDPHGEVERTVSFNFTTKLKCRPKTQLCLSCRIDEADISSTVFNGLSKHKSHVINESWEFNKERQGGPFELNFNRHGLREIVMSSSLNPTVIGILKGLAEQLNIGADLPSIPISVFAIMENATTGQCRTDYVMSSNKLNDDDVGKGKMNSYEIVIVPTMRSARGIVRGIKKTKYMDKCPYRYDYYDRDWNEIGRALSERNELPNYSFETELKSSTSRMVITESNFTSHTEEAMIITDQEEKSTYRHNRKMTISLYEIVPAEGPLRKIDDPTTVSIYSIERLHSDNSE